jgi:putative ABC transport system permease protein
LGLKPFQISTLFVLEGALIGLVGVMVGVGLGLLINVVLQQVGLDFRQFSSISTYMALINTRVYPTLGLEQILQRTLMVLMITTLAALYPAREAAQREPAAALHYV